MIRGGRGGQGPGPWETRLGWGGHIGKIVDELWVDDGGVERTREESGTNERGG